MDWNDCFGSESLPTNGQIEDFIASPLWRELNDHLCQTYKIEPKVEYSACAMDNGFWKGWNVKYKKRGKSLCTLYPKQGYFLSLVPIELREMNEAELLMPQCSEYTQSLFRQTVTGHNGKSLAFHVKNENILHDVKTMIALRAASTIPGR